MYTHLLNDLDQLLIDQPEHKHGINAAINLVKSHCPTFQIGQVLHHELLGDVRINHISESTAEHDEKKMYFRTYHVEQVNPDTDPFGDPYRKMWKFTEERMRESPFTAVSTRHDERYGDYDMLNFNAMESDGM